MGTGLYCRHLRISRENLRPARRVKILPKDKGKVCSGEGNEPLAASNDFMNVVEIEVENHRQYHKKGVIAHIMTGTRPEVHEGVIDRRRKFQMDAH